MIPVINKPCAKGNFRVGRRGRKPEAIVIHIAEGSAAGTDAWFNNPKAKVSAHYLVTKTGEIHQYVDEANTAFHAGLVDRPTWLFASVFPNGVNDRTIGIEHEGFATKDITEAQYEASAALIVEICVRHSIPITPACIVPHYAIRASKTCPGRVDVSRLIVLAYGNPIS